jgi:predicted MPP superfamily phosphohydrolase
VNRREFLKTVAVATGTVITGATALLGCKRKESVQTEDSFAFAFFADVHIRSGGRVERLRNCIRAINDSGGCDFAISGGDMIEDALGASYETAKTYYDLFDSTINDLKVPVHYTIGNHELFGVYEASGVSPDHPEYGKEMYRRRVGNGRTYYSFDHKGWHFIVLDSIQIKGRDFVGSIDQQQLEWLRADLWDTGRKRPIILAMHIPMVSSWVQLRHGITVAPSPQGFIVNNKDLYATLEHYNVRLVLAGHLHVLEDWTFLRTRYINAGAVSGGWGPNTLDGPGSSFGMVTIKGEDVAYEHITLPIA